MSRNFVMQSRMPTVEWGGPIALVAYGSKLNVLQACVVDVGSSGAKMKGMCGVIDFFHDALLSMDFVNTTKFMLNFGEQTLSNPKQI